MTVVFKATTAAEERQQHEQSQSKEFICQAQMVEDLCPELAGSYREEDLQNVTTQTSTKLQTQLWLVSKAVK